MQSCSLRTNSARCWAMRRSSMETRASASTCRKRRANSACSHCSCTPSRSWAVSCARTSSQLTLPCRHSSARSLQTFSNFAQAAFSSRDLSACMVARWLALTALARKDTSAEASALSSARTACCRFDSASSMSSTSEVNLALRRSAVSLATCSKRNCSERDSNLRQRNSTDNSASRIWAGGAASTTSTPATACSAAGASPPP
mmetsp:Transcript_75941/g.162886  ORF Transcript_75941/g.162886 Transcript_75941/m.162886 type:complete len:202 (-) Transcript_75941:106-711(-)